MNSFPVGRSRRLALTAVTLLGGSAISARGDTRKAWGFDKTTPYEFRLVNRARPSLPPDYALRPPQPGASRPQEQTVPEQARQVLIGASGTAARPAAPAGVSAGEAALLAKAGATRSDPRIREMVDRDSVTLADADRTFLDRIVFWKKPDPPGTVVDPQAEAQRLRENQALGKPVTDGDTPIIRRRKKGALEGIF